MSRPTRITLSVVLALCLSWSSKTRGEVIFSQTDSTDWNCWWTAQFDNSDPAHPYEWELGDDFTLSQDATLGEIRIATFLTSQDREPVRLRLYVSDGDVPQADPFYEVHVALSYVGAAPGGYDTFPNILQSLVLPGEGVSLHGGTRYWWTVVGENFNVGVAGYLSGSGGGTPGSVVQRFWDDEAGYGSWEIRNSNTYVEMLSAAPIPEPTSLVLWSGLGVAGLIAGRLRKRTARHTAD